MSEQPEGFMDRLSAHLDRGWELVTQGDLNGAMASAEQTLELDGDSPDAHNLIGYIHAANGNLDLALDHYRQAIELDEHYLEAMLNAANASMVAAAMILKNGFIFFSCNSCKLVH